MNGRIIDGEREFRFQNLRTLQMEVDGKPWVFAKITGTQISFTYAPMGGYAGIRKYVKSWRKREGYTQAEAATRLRKKQSMISKIENGKRRLTPEMFEIIRKDNLLYEKSDIDPEHQAKLDRLEKPGRYRLRYGQPDSSKSTSRMRIK